MASTTFIDGATTIVASWLNDVNTVVYRGFSNYAATATALTYSDSGILAGLASSVAGYNQMLIQNTNAGTTASANFVASNNVGTATTNFVEMGINSSAFTGTGAFSQPSYGYVATASTDLAVGTYGNNSIHFVTNGAVTDGFTIQAVTGTAGAPKFPVLTTANKNLLGNIQGAIVYDSTLAAFSGNNGTAWGSLGSGAATGANTDITSLGALTTYPYIPVRQTVLSGPVNTSGMSAFGGSTGSTTVTAAGTLIATAANGFSTIGTIDRVGSIVNPSWTGLSTNGTMYLYLDIASNGTCTTGSTTLLPTYRWGGADVTTNNQFTFNVQEMVGKVGNGATATQTFRVFVGEVLVASSVVSTITWYSLMGRFASGSTTPLAGVSTPISATSNIGTAFILGGATLTVECITTEHGYAVGDCIDVLGTASSAQRPMTPGHSRNTTFFSTNSTTAFTAHPKGGGEMVALTAANWSYRMTIDRGW